MSDFKNVLMVTLTAGASLGLALDSSAQGYRQVYDLDTANAATNNPSATPSDGIFAVAVGPDGLYNHLTGGGQTRITRTTQVGGSWVTTEVSSDAQWDAVSGSATSSDLMYYGFGFSGPDTLQAAATSTDSVWQFNSLAGTPTEVVSSTDITTLTGQTSALISTNQTIDPNGRHVFYEGRSDSVLRTTGNAAAPVEILISDTQLTTATGGDVLLGGFAYDPAGRLIFGSGSDDGIWAYDESDSSFEQLISAADLAAVTPDVGSIVYRDIFYAPDGRVYFNENLSDDIFAFSLADASDLQIVLTKEQLINGAMGSELIGQLTWYDGNLAWASGNASSTSGIVQGVYTIPEPGVASLLAATTLGLLGRRWRVA